MNALPLTAAVSILMALTALPGQAQCRVEKRVKDNRIAFILENEHLRLSVNPETGRATELLFKTLDGDRNMASKHGLFGEVAPGFGGSWTGRILEEGPDRVAVELTQSGGKPPQWHLNLVKTIALERDRSSVSVRYQVHNKGDGPAKIALRPHSGLRFPGTVEGLDGLLSEDSWFYAPAPQGVRSMKDAHFKPRPGEVLTSGDFVEVDPVDGWTAGRSVSGVGFAATMDWSLLDAVLTWCDKYTGATVEWGFLEQALTPGDRHEAGYTFSFFTGMPPIAGAREDVAVGIELPEPVPAGAPAPIRVAVGSGRARPGITVTLELATRPDARGSVVGETRLDLAPGVAGQAAFQAALADNATHVLTAVVRENGREIARGVRVAALGRTPRGYLAPVPEGGKRGDSYWGNRFRATYSEADTSVPEHYGHMDLETVTPHVSWLKPHAGGEARVMFLTRPDYFKYSVREVVQRCAIIPDFSFVFQTKRAGVFVLEEYRSDVIEAMGRILAASPNEVLYFCSLNWNWLPDEFKARVLDRVEAGLGIVLAGGTAEMKPFRAALASRAATRTDDGARLLGSISPAADLGVRLGGMETFTLGRGRVVFLTYAVMNMYDYFLPSVLPAAYPEYPWWEQYYALVGRTILWAAGKEAGLTVTPADLTAAGASGRIAGPAADRVRTLRFLAVNDDRAEMGRVEAPVAGGAAACVWPTPLAGGRYTVGLVALDAEGRSLGFAARKLQVEAPVAIGLRIDPPFVRGPARPKAEITLAAEKSLKGRVEVRLTDRFGRLLFQRTEDAETGGAPIRVDLRDVRPIAVGHWLTVDFWHAGVRLATVRQPVRFWPAGNRLDREFSGAVWGTVSQGPYAEAILRASSACGLDRLYVGPTTESVWSSLTLAVDLGFDFYMLDINPITDLFDFTGGGTKPASAWDASVFSAAAERARAMAERGREVAVDHYLLRDEYHLRAPGKDLTKDDSPPTLAAFRAFLKQDYAGLEALNAEWETAFTAWEEVGRPEPKNGPGWNDWQAFWDTYMVKHMAVTREAVQQVNPQGKVGMSGCQRPGDGKGWDWWLLMKEAAYFHRYNHFQEDWINSFGSDEVVQGQWFGYLASREVDAQYHLWSGLLTGSHLASYYKLMLSTAPNQDMGVTTHDIRLRPYYAFVGKEMATLNTGLARQILACAHRYDPIALYHSQRSNLAGGDTLNATYAFKRLIEDSGFRFTTVDSRDVLRGALAERGIRVLVLPQVVCVSEAERDRFAAFVEAGGILVTDQNTGLRDGHGKPRQAGGILDPLFGLTRRMSDMAGKAAGRFAATPQAGGALREYRALQVAAAAKGIVPEKAQPWLQTKEGIPAVLVHAVGKGRTIYLNLDLANYASSAAGGVFGEETEDTQGVAEYTASCVDLMRGLLAETAGLRPRAAARVHGEPLVDTRVYYLNRGNLDLVGFLRGREGQPVETSIALPKRAHVYELRSDPRYFGETDAVTATLRPAVGAVFALLPYEVERVELRGPERIRAGEVLTLAGAIVPKGGAAGEHHVVRLEVAGPDGRPLACFAANLDAPSGRFTCDLPLALNDPAGRWSVTATDCISRKAVTMMVTVEP